MFTTLLAITQLLNFWVHYVTLPKIEKPLPCRTWSSLAAGLVLMRRQKTRNEDELAGLSVKCQINQHTWFLSKRCHQTSLVHALPDNIHSYVTFSQGWTPKGWCAKNLTFRSLLPLRSIRLLKVTSFLWHWMHEWAILNWWPWDVTERKIRPNSFIRSWSIQVSLWDLRIASSASFLSSASCPTIKRGASALAGLVDNGLKKEKETIIIIARVFLSSCTTTEGYLASVQPPNIQGSGVHSVHSVDTGTDQSHHYGFKLCHSWVGLLHQKIAPPLRVTLLPLKVSSLQSNH